MLALLLFHDGKHVWVNIAICDFVHGTQFWKTVPLLVVLRVQQLEMRDKNHHFSSGGFSLLSWGFQAQKS